MFRVILVRTSGAKNAGLAARAVANFGPGELMFVSPQDPGMFATCDFYQMAHGVEERRSRFPVVTSLEDALADATDTIGFTARMRRHRNIEDFDGIAAELADRIADPAARVALVFGNEADGLTDAETAPLARLVHVRTSQEQPSINLGAAVSLVLARLYRGAGAKSRSRRFRPLTVAQRSLLEEHLKRSLLPRVRGETSKRDLEASIERICAQAPLETRDARAWHRLARALLGEIESPPG